MSPSEIDDVKKKKILRKFVKNGLDNIPAKYNQPPPPQYNQPFKSPVLIGLTLFCMGGG